MTYLILTNMERKLTIELRSILGVSIKIFRNSPFEGKCLFTKNEFMLSNEELIFRLIKHKKNFNNDLIFVGDSFNETTIYLYQDK